MENQGKARQGMSMTWHGNDMECHGMYWKGMTMAWKWRKWKWCGNVMPWNGLESNDNGMEMECHGKAWHGNGMTSILFWGLGLGRSFVSLCALTKTLGRNVQ
jgi:hypothetical protein